MTAVKTLNSVFVHNVLTLHIFSVTDCIIVSLRVSCHCEYNNSSFDE